MTERVQQDLIRGTLHLPEEQGANGGIVLAHGASSNSDSRLLVALASAFASSGRAAFRVDLPFRQRRPSGPPHPSTASQDREGLHQAANYMRRFGSVWLAGHSYGGRQASMLMSEVPDAADALLLLSYPLHPPGKAQQPRTAHFPELRKPVLFVHGTRDPFGSPDELQTAIQLIPGRCRLHLVEGAGHDLRQVITRPGEAVSLMQEFYAESTSAR